MIYSVFSPIYNFVNNPGLKSATKWIISFPSLLFIHPILFEISHTNNTKKKPSNKPPLYQPTPVKISGYIARVAIIGTALLTPWVTKGVIRLFRGTRVHRAHLRAFSPYSTFKANPTHPIHILSVLNLALSAQNLAITLFYFLKTDYYNKFNMNKFAEIIITAMCLYNTATHRTTLHAVNSLFRKVIQYQ